MRIEIDEDTCIGAGQCVLTAPDVFDQNPDDGRAFLLKEDLDAGEEALAQEAAAVCPSGAITVVDRVD